MNELQLLLLMGALPWVGFELWQLIVAERYLGLKQIEKGIDPRTLPMGEGLAACWTFALVAYWCWMGLMLFQPLGRTQILLSVGVSLLGFSLRRNSPMKWILVILTIEGAIRFGMLISVLGVVWHRL